jgi:hypothetical protein
LQKFYEEKIITIVKPKLPNKLVFESDLETALTMEGQGFYSGPNNVCILREDTLFNPDFNKLVNKFTGECIQDPTVKWQMTGRREFLEGEMKKLKIKNAEIIPMTKKERLGNIKRVALHETDHGRQFCNQLLHEDLGFDKVFDRICKDNNINNEKALEVKEYCYKIWEPLLNSGKKIKRNSSLGRKTMNQFIDQSAVTTEPRGIST